jgi:hypothetical protein
MITSLLMTMIAIAMAVLLRFMRKCAINKRTSGLLSLSWVLSIALASVYFYLIRYDVIERDLYRVGMLFVVVIYFGFLESYRSLAAKSRLKGDGGN